MFIGSATTSFPETHTQGSFLRDVAASLATLGALGALLLAIQLHSGKPAAAPVKAPAVQTQPREVEAQRQPRDVAAMPMGDEQAVAQAMVAFALSKVSPLQPEPVASIPTTAIVAQSRTPRKPKPAQTARPSPSPSPSRPAPAPAAPQFAQVEWPGAAATKPAPVVEVAATPGDQAAVVAASRFSWRIGSVRQLELGRFVPNTGSIADGASTLASGARKTIGHGMAGFRSGASAVQDAAVSVATRLW